MKIPLLGPLIDFATKLGTKWMDRKMVEAEGKILIAQTRASTEAKILVTRAESDAAWEQTQAENAGTSWKDEFWTLLIALPIPFVFYPDTRPWIIEGFKALNEVPEWYMWAIAASISASFGIKTGLFDAMKKKITGKAPTRG